jgi:hypothetical protein
MFNSVLYKQPGWRDADEELLKDPVPTGWDERVCPRPAWFDRLDSHERLCLFRSALLYHRRVLSARAACKDADYATLCYREPDKVAMAICCKLLGEPVPEYKSWDQFQKHWPKIEAALEKWETEGSAASH